MDLKIDDCRRTLEKHPAQEKLFRGSSDDLIHFHWKTRQLKIANEYFSKEVFYLIRNKMAGCKISVRSRMACSCLGEKKDKNRLSPS